ncbi:MAG TPA: anti-sigma factor [Methylomirabilota bacterium]
MNHDEVVELAAGYALGALDVGERARFEALLAAGDVDARAALRDFELTVATLAAETAETPPPVVKSALMARIDAEERSRGNVTRVLSMPRSAPPHRSLWTVVAVGAMAAGVAAIAVGFAVSTVYDRRIGQLAQEQTELKRELARQESLVTILRDPATQIVALSGLAPAPEAKARVLWHATAGGLLVAQGLPPAPAGKAYELWAIAGTGAPMPAGVFAVDAKGVGSLRVAPLKSGGPPDTFAVTLEPAGGVAAPTGSMYLVGKL